MNANQLLDVIGEAKTEYLQAALATREKRSVRRNVHKIVLIAAVVSLMAILLGCAIAALKLNDMKIGEFTVSVPQYIDKNGEMVYSTRISGDVISLQGVEGSPEYLAAQEWDAFEWDYIINRSDEIENDFRAPEDYDAYLVGNQEMQDKIDEICAKYDLKLLGPVAVTQHYEQDIFFAALGLSGLTRPGAEATVEDSSGYFYANGNFKQEFWLTLTGEEAQWPHQILMSYNLKHKGYFDAVFMTLKDVNIAKQWQYTLADGTEVLIINAGDTAHIFCDREDAFLSVGFSILYQSESNSDVMTNRDIELVAEALDFTLKPVKPDMDMVKAMLAESQSEYLAQQEAEMESYVDPWVKDSYQDYIEMLLENMEIADVKYTYGFADLNDDGIQELLIADVTYYAEYDNFFTEALTIKDGQTAMYLSFTSPTYICEDNVVEYIDPTRDNWRCYNFLDPATGEYGNGLYLNYHTADDVWVCGTYDKAWPEEISEEEALSIIDSHPRARIEMKPITDFPMEE